MTIMGLSRVMGPVAAKAPGDPTDAAQIASALGGIIDSEFDPTEFFDLDDLMALVSISR